MNRKWALIPIAFLSLAVSCGGGGGKSAPPPGIQAGSALVSLAFTDELAVVDLKTATVTRSVPSTVIPGAVIIRPDGERAYVVATNPYPSFLPSDDYVVEYDLTTDPISLSGKSVYLNTASNGSATTPISAVFRDGELALVTNENYFALWAPATDSLIYTYVTSASAATPAFFDVTGTADGSRFFVADTENDSIWVLDDQASVINTLFYASSASGVPGTSDGPNMLILSPDETRLYVANSETDIVGASEDLLVFSVNTSSGLLSFLKSVPLSDAAVTAHIYASNGMEITSDGSEIWIAADEITTGNPLGSVIVYDTTGDTVDVIGLPVTAGGEKPIPYFLAVSRDEQSVYVPGYDTSLIYVIDRATKSVAGTISMPSLGSSATTTYPYGIGIGLF